MKQAFDVQHRFFIPLWRRVLVVAVCVFWAIYEFANGNIGWGLVPVAAGVWCAHQFFFIAFDPVMPEIGSDIAPDAAETRDNTTGDDP